MGSMTSVDEFLAGYFADQPGVPVAASEQLVCNAHRDEQHTTFKQDQAATYQGMSSGGSLGQSPPSFALGPAQFRHQETVPELPSNMVPNHMTRSVVWDNNSMCMQSGLGQQPQQQQHDHQLQQQQQQQWQEGSMLQAPSPTPVFSFDHESRHSGGAQRALPMPAGSTTFSAGKAKTNCQPLSSNGGAGGATNGAGEGLGGGAAAPAAAGATLPLEDEPDLSHLTVMQRYHTRRKLAVQRMEREVEEKIAQLNLLEQENRRLKWHAHILENMLLDIDKQLEVMTSSDAAPDASQWLTLLGMGQDSSAGRQQVARTVHKVLEGASTVDIANWTVQDCRRCWQTYLEQLQPLVEAAEVAQAAYRASRTPDQQDTEVGSSRRPRRAAAAAAQAMIQQEAAEVLGVAPVRSSSSIPAPPPPPPSCSAVTASGAAPPAGPLHSSSNGSSAPGCAAGEQPHPEQQAASPLTAAQLANVEGIPEELLAQIEDLVLHNFYWLLAIMSTNPLLTYQFISTDLLGREQPLPPEESQLWVDATERLHITLEQMQECSTCIQVSRRCMAKVMQERAEIQSSMQCGVESEMHMSSADGMLQLNSRDAAVERMRANMRKESVVRNMVGFYCINVLSIFQLAQVSLAAFPWFPMAWRVIAAVEKRLTQHLQEQAQAGGRPSRRVGAQSSRSSTSQAAQR